MLNPPLSTCQYPFKNSFQTALPMKKYLKDQPFIMKIHLNKAGYISKLVSHISSANNQENKNKLNIIWFNPPYNKNVTARIGQSFLHLIETHFPKKHTFNTILNRNKVQVSYSCMQKIKKIMIVTWTFSIKDVCNCRNKNYCPLGGKCLSPNIIYQGKITSSQPNYTEDIYFGVAENHSKIL